MTKHFILLTLATITSTALCAERRADITVVLYQKGRSVVIRKAPENITKTTLGDITSKITSACPPAQDCKYVLAHPFCSHDAFGNLDTTLAEVASSNPRLLNSFGDQVLLYASVIRNK